MSKLKLINKFLNLINFHIVDDESPRHRNGRFKEKPKDTVSVPKRQPIRVNYYGKTIDYIQVWTPRY